MGSLGLSPAFSGVPCCLVHSGFMQLEPNIHDTVVLEFLITGFVAAMATASDLRGVGGGTIDVLTAIAVMPSWSIASP